jgi:hypothetical protein
VSFDIFLQCVRDGMRAAFKRSLFEEIFSRGAIDPQLPLIHVGYSDGHAEIYGADEGEDIGHLMFSHCGGATFFAALYELADRSGSMIFWPSLGRSMAVTRTETIAHLPEDMGEMGPPYVVSDGHELQDCIFHD